MGKKVKGLNTVSSEQPRFSMGNWFNVLLFIVIVGLIAAGFIILNWNSLRPSRNVQVASVLALPGASDYKPKNKIAFQAAGWIEAAPLPIKHSSLVGGLVKEMLVVEGQKVKKGQVIARLIDEDIKLELLELNAKRSQIEAKIDKEKAEQQAAMTAVSHHQRKIETSRKKLDLLMNKRNILFKAGNAVRKLDRDQAELQLSVQKAVINEVEFEKKLLQAEVDIKNADIKTAQAELSIIDADIAKEKLDLERTQIKSPIDGVISRLFIHVGRRISEMPDNPSGALVAEFYKPEHLQVKVDIPLIDAGRLFVEQKAQISVEALPDAYFSGIVTSIVGWVDVNRNTLQTKVEIIKPHKILRPGMLARVQFLHAATKKGKGQLSGRLRILIPKSALFDHKNDEAKVWSVDRIRKTVQKITISVGNQHKDDYIEVKSGLKPGQLILPRGFDGLQDGDKVNFEIN